MKTSSRAFRVRLFLIAMIALAALSTLRHPAVADESLSRQTGVGRAVLIRGFAEFDGDCGGHAAERIRVIRAPTRGRIEQRRGKVALGPGDVDGKSCAGATLDGVQVYYVPNDGFVGSDRFAFDVDYPSRRSIRAQVVVAVDGAASRS